METITNEHAYAFHRAISDGSLGANEVEEIKTGLRAAFAELETARAEDQATIQELRERLNRLSATGEECEFNDQAAMVFPLDEWNDFENLFDRPTDYSALNEALAREDERLADNVTLLVGINASPQERYRLRDSLREEAAAHRAKGGQAST